MFLLIYLTFLNNFNLMSAFDELSLNDYIVIKHNDTDVISSRSFFSNRLRWWPTTTIPYEIAPGFTEIQKETIINAIEKNFHKVTCLTFVEHTTEEDYIIIINDHSQVPAGLYIETDQIVSTCGWATQRMEEGGKLILFLNVTSDANGSDCVKPWVIVHEMLHALGFIHEHERVDRDCYLESEQNPSPLMRGEYDGVDHFWPFDYLSVMLYSSFTPKHVQVDSVGSSSHVNTKFTMSVLDLQKVRFFFCKQPHFCDLNRQACININKWEQRRQCVQN